VYQLETQNLLHPSQAGFRRNRSNGSTKKQTAAVCQLLQDGFQQRRPPLRTALLLADFSRAYNRVWRKALIAKIACKGLPFGRPPPGIRPWACPLADLHERPLGRLTWHAAFCLCRRYHFWSLGQPSRGLRSCIATSCGSPLQVVSTMEGLTQPHQVSRIFHLQRSTRSQRESCSQNLLWNNPGPIWIYSKALRCHLRPLVLTRWKLGRHVT